MLKRFRVLACVALGSVLLAATLPVSAAAGTCPMAFLRDHDARVKELLSQAAGDSLSPALRDTLRHQINHVFDFRELSRRALGTHWEARTDAEREHFVDTFSAIIQERNLDAFVRYYRNGSIEYQDHTVAADSATVTARVPLSKQEIGIEYRLLARDDTWRVYDLVIDGVSTAASNRTRYGRYIDKYSYEKLIGQLEKQLDRIRTAD